MPRVVQRVFEQATHIGSVRANRQTTRPAIRPGIVGELRETHRLFL
jgi:hypothetical protein